MYVRSPFPLIELVAWGRGLARGRDAQDEMAVIRGPRGKPNMTHDMIRGSKIASKRLQEGHKRGLIWPHDGLKRGRLRGPQKATCGALYSETLKLIRMHIPGWPHPAPQDGPKMASRMAMLIAAASSSCSSFLSSCSLHRLALQPSSPYPSPRQTVIALTVQPPPPSICARGGPSWHAHGRRARLLAASRAYSRTRSRC